MESYFVAPEIHWPIILIVCLFMVLDLITGFVQACVNKNVESSKMKTGLLHKCGFLLAVMFGALCEYAMNYVNLGFTIPVQDAVCIFIIATEVVSNLENLGKISPELANAKFMNIFKTEEQ